MLLNETQQEIYQLSLDFLVERLNDILEKSKFSKSAVNAACFLLYVTLKYKRFHLEKMAIILYPEEQYQIVRNIFLEIHDLINLKKRDHSFIKSITDPRFFSNSLNTPEYKVKLQETIASLFKEDLAKWLTHKYEAKIVSHKTLLGLEHLYSTSALANDSDISSVVQQI